jgi:hypothetical protein
MRVVKALEYATDMGVFLGVVFLATAPEADLWGRLEKVLLLRNRAQLCLIHVDHHSRVEVHAPFRLLPR